MILSIIFSLAYEFRMPQTFPVQAFRSISYWNWIYTLVLNLITSVFSINKQSFDVNKKGNSKSYQ